MEVTQTIETQVRIRVAMSGEHSARYVHHVADLLERKFGVKGSTVIGQAGRWDGAVEDGHVIEVCIGSLWPTADSALRTVGAVLQDYVGVTGLTFFCTAEKVLVTEVF